MRLPTLDRVVFDEFPSDNTVKYCIFTQPKYPQHDYSEYSNRVIYCATESTLFVLLALKKLAIKRYMVLSERKVVRHMRSTKFSVRAIPTGNVSGSVMLLIKIGEAIVFYTGQFNKCQSTLLEKITKYYRNQIQDIYVDNTMAALKSPELLHQACDEIKNIVSSYPEYKIFLHVELFGYEELLYELARLNIKIQLNELQKYHFEKCGHGALFKFDGLPQLKVYSLLQGGEPFQECDYKMMFEKHQIIHIRLAMSQHIFREPSKMKGLVYVPYTPHAGAHELKNLFEMVQPKRVHPLVKQSYIHDPLTVIPKDVLNDGCEIVGYELNESFDNESLLSNSNRLSAESKSSFLHESSLSNDELLENVSDLVFHPDSDESQKSGDERKKSNASEEMKRNANIQQSLANVSNQMNNEIISLDEEDDEEEDDIFNLAMQSTSGVANASNSIPNKSMRLETDKNVIMRIDIESQQSEPVSITVYEAVDNLPDKLPEKDSVKVVTNQKSPIRIHTHRQEQPPAQKPLTENSSQKTASRKLSFEKSINLSTAKASDPKSAKQQETTSKAIKRSDANNNGVNSSNVANNSMPVRRNEALTIDSKDKKKEASSNIRQMAGIKRRTTTPHIRMQRVEYLTDSDEEREKSDHNCNIHRSKVQKMSESKLPEKKMNKVPLNSNNTTHQISELRPPTTVQMSSKTVENDRRKEDVSGTQNDGIFEARTIRSVPEAETKSERNLSVDDGHESDTSSSSDGYVVFRRPPIQNDGGQRIQKNVAIDNAVNTNCQIITDDTVDSSTKNHSQHPNHDHYDSDSSSSDGYIVFPE